MSFIFKSLALAALTAVATAASAADKIKVGMLGTATGGPTITVSKGMKDGFDLRVKELGGKLGGLPVEVVTGDDQANSDVGKQAFDRMVKRDKVDVVTGVAASGVIYAVAPLATQQQVFFLNPNVGSRDLVGDKCSPYYFNTGWHIESVNESMGKYMAALGLKKVFVIAAGVAVGREHIDGFKRGYGAPLAGEIYFKPQTLDFSAELAQIRTAQPDAVYAFAFGPLSVNFVKQYGQAGLSKIPLFGASPLADEDTIPAQGEAAAGVVTGGHWVIDLPHKANTDFVAAFTKEYGHPPALYNEQGYTTALVLDAAVRAVNGKIEDKAAFRKALESVNLDTPRGPFRFDTDHSPIENTYLRKVEKSDKGLVNRTQKVIAKGQPARTAAACTM